VPYVQNVPPTFRDGLYHFVKPKQSLPYQILVYIYKETDKMRTKYQLCHICNTCNNQCVLEPEPHTGSSQSPIRNPMLFCGSPNWCSTCLKMYTNCISNRCFTFPIKIWARFQSEIISPDLLLTFVHFKNRRGIRQFLRR
jgi:hypothetical protein